LSQLKNIFKCDTTIAIFLYQFERESEVTCTNEQVLHWAIQDLSPKLAKKSWRSYPAAQFCFSWILHQAMSPNVGPRLSEFLPFTLCFIDDWELKNKVMGLTCLDHIVKEANQTELKWYGRADLIKDALKKLLMCREENVVGILIPCWLRLLAKVENHNDYSKVDGWDLLTKELLYKIEMETKIDLKRAYCKQLKPLVEALCIGCVRWMTSILRVISSYLDYPESCGIEDIRIDGLEALQALLQFGKPRVQFHAKTIFEMLLRLLYDITKKMDSSANDNQKLLYSKCSELLKLSATFAPSEFILLCDGMEHVKVNEYFDSVIKNVFTEISTEEKEIFNGAAIGTAMA